jgi:hypothetical protein
MKTEAETLVELEKLLDALEPDARKRALDFVAAKYGPTSKPSDDWSKCPRPHKTAAEELGAKPEPIDWTRLFRENQPNSPVPTDPPIPFPGTTFVGPQRTGCAFDGLPPGVYGLVCTCPRCQIYCGASPFKILAASGMTDKDLARFTACAASLPPEFVGNGTAIFFGPGAALPGGPPMRSLS